MADEQLGAVAEKIRQAVRAEIAAAAEEEIEKAKRNLERRVVGIVSEVGIRFGEKMNAQDFGNEVMIVITFNSRMDAITVQPKGMPRGG